MKIVVTTVDEIKTAIEKLRADFSRIQENTYKNFASRPNFNGMDDAEIRKIYMDANREAINSRFRTYCKQNIGILVESGRVAPEQRRLYAELLMALNSILKTVRWPD